MGWAYLGKEESENFHRCEFVRGEVSEGWVGGIHFKRWGLVFDKKRAVVLRSKIDRLRVVAASVV